MNQDAAQSVQTLPRDTTPAKLQIPDGISDAEKWRLLDEHKKSMSKGMKK